MNLADKCNFQFKYVNLENSLVYGWIYKNQVLTVNLDIEINEGHELYKKPPSNERASFTKGTLIFNNILKINGLLLLEDVKPTANENEKPDYDLIHCLWKTNEGFYFEGEFGEVNLKSDDPILILDNEFI